MLDVKRAPRERWTQVQMEEVTARPDRLATVGPDEDLVPGLATMDDANVAPLPLVVVGEPLGMLSPE